MTLDINQIRFDGCGLVPAVIQDARTREVLSLAYMNAESLQRTLETRETWFWSRSRSELWHKGTTSGNTQRVIELRQDCDSDALILLVEPAGPACHTGARTCFYRDIDGDEVNLSSRDENASLGLVLDGLYDLVQSRQREMPEGSYTTYLFREGLDKILKKVGEEATETIIAAKNEGEDRLVSESADLLYHLVVLLAAREVTLAQVSNELIGRRR